MKSNKKTIIFQMKTKLLFLTLLLSVFSWGQVQLSEGTPSQTIDFSATVSGVSNGAFTGTGFQATPTAGQLDSDAWASTGMSDGPLAFGGARTIGDYARGAVNAAQSTGGFYAYTGAPQSAANPCLMIQPAGSDFAPGTLTLRIQNNGTAFINQMVVSYDLFVRNDQARASSFNFSYSSDNTTYTPVAALNYTSIEVADALGWVQVGSSPSRSTTITGLSVAPGDFFYIRWNSADVSGANNRDEFGLDNIALTATFGLPSFPVITSDLNASGFVGSPFSYTITAINAPTSFNATGMPAWMSVNTATGQLTGTPTATGTFLITISATNGAGTDFQTLILTITDPGPEINVRGATGGTNNIVNGNTIPNAFNNTLFASVALGSNQVKDYIIQNIGTNILNLTGTPRVVISGTHAADFTVVAQPAASINPGNNLVFEIRFEPLAGGVRTAIVSIANNDSDENPYTFTIQGTGLAPQIDVIGNGQIITPGSTTTSLTNHTNFGNVNVTVGTRARSFYIINYGGDNLNLTLPITITGPNAADFTITTVPTTPVIPSNNTTVVITFNPSALGYREAIVTIQNNVPSKNPYVFTISGVGIDFDECTFSGFSNIRTQNFETTANWPYTVSTQNGGNIPVVGAGTNFGTDRTTPSNMFLTTNSLQVRGPYPTTFDPKAKVILDFDAVDLTLYNEARLQFSLGAFSTNNSQGLDVSDWVTVSISIDNGVTWSKELIIRGSNNSIWSIATSTGTFAGPYKGIDIPTQIGSTSNSTNTGPRSITINNLPITSQLRVRIELENDLNTEIWVVDNVIVSGTLPLSSTFLNATSTWSPGPPTSTTRAIFAGNYNTALHGNVTACECLINPSRTVTVTPGGFLDIGGRITNNGTLNVQNGGSIIQKDDYAVNAGNNVTVSKATVIKRLDYVYWSSPVENFPLLSVSPGTSASLHFKWNPTIGGNFGNWQVANENMVRGKGYIIRAPNAYTNTPAPFSTNFVGRLHNGFIPVDISRGNYTGGGYPSPTNSAITVTADDDNFNLIGNPYPSAISALDFLTDNTNIEGSVRLWTHGLDPSLIQNDPFYGNFAYNYDPNDYIVYNGTMTVSGPSGFAGYIASGQSFFVLMNDGPQTTEQVIFKNSLRNATYDNSQFFKSAPTKNTEQVASDLKIWLDIISPNGKAVRTALGYVENATNQKDRLFDASTKLDGTTKLYTLIDSKPFIIQGRTMPHTLDDQVDLGFFAAQPGMYTIAIGAIKPSNSAIPVYLEDKVLGIIHNLKESPYHFSTALGVNDSRFVLRYTNETLSLDPVENNENEVKVFSPQSGQINVKSISEEIVNIQVFDILGRELLNQKGNNQEIIQLNLTTSNQAVLVKIVLNNGKVMAKKIILK